MEKTFAGALRMAQGVFVIHYHGGARRPFGHPHAHTLLSPRLTDSVALQYIPRTRLARMKDRWEREVTLAVGRFEERALAHTAERLPVWALTPLREARPRSLGDRLLELAARRAATAALGRPAGVLLRPADALRAARQGPAGIFKRVAPRLTETVMPGPSRTALRAVRLWGRITGGNGHGRDE